MAEYTLVNIEELPSGTAGLSNKIMFGIGELLHTDTLQNIKDLILQGAIAEIPPNKIKLINVFPDANYHTNWQEDQLNAVGVAINYTVTNFWGGEITADPNERLVFRVIESSYYEPEPGVLIPNILWRYYSLVSGTLSFTGITSASDDLVPNGVVNQNIEGVIDLGDIGTDAVETAFNADGDAPFTMDSYSFIMAVQDDQQKLWKWIGGDGLYGGVGTPAVTQDFFQLTPENDNPNPQNLPNEVIWGRKVIWTGTGLNFKITTGLIRFNGQQYLKLESPVITLDPADAINDRIDTFFDSPTTQGAITGTPAATPVAPQVNPLSQIFLTTADIAATATTPGGVTDEPIYLENTEWTGSKTGTGTVNFDATTNPKTGAKHISVLKCLDGLRVIMTNDSDLDFTDFEDISLQIQTLVNIGTSISQSITIGLLDNSDNELITPYQLPLTYTTDYQLIGIAIDQLNFLGSTTGRKVYIQYNSLGVNGFEGFNVDDWRLQGGIDQPNPGGTETPPVHKHYDSQAAMIADQAQQKKKWLYFDGTQYWEYLGTTIGTIADYRPNNQTASDILGTLHNTVIGGVGATINTKALLAAQLTGVGVDDISNFYLVGNDVYAQINTNYTSIGNIMLTSTFTMISDPEGRFVVGALSIATNGTNLISVDLPKRRTASGFGTGSTTYPNCTRVDLNGLVSISGVSPNTFYNFTGLTDLRISSLRTISTTNVNWFNNLPALLTFYAPSLDSITTGNNSFIFGNLTRFYAPNLKSLTLGSGSFTGFAAGCVITVHSDLATAGTGGTEHPALAAARAAGATIVYHQGLTEEIVVNSPILDDPTHIVTVDETGEELGRNVLVSRDILNQTADDIITVTGTTAETSLILPTFGTQTLDPADMKAGQVLNFEGFGVYSATSDDFDLRFKLGSQSVTVSMAVTGTASNLPWRFRGYVKFTGGADATRTFRFSGVVVRERSIWELIEYAIPITELTIDATTAQTFDITSQATDKANSITLNDSILTYGN